jgi:hypothetical protein
MYGKQVVRVRCSKPAQVISDSPGLTVESYAYLPGEGMLEIAVKGSDMQGSRGIITLQY